MERRNFIKTLALWLSIHSSSVDGSDNIQQSVCWKVVKWERTPSNKIFYDAVIDFLKNNEDICSSIKGSIINYTSFGNNVVRIWWELHWYKEIRDEKSKIIGYTIIRVWKKTNTEVLEILNWM